MMENDRFSVLFNRNAFYFGQEALLAFVEERIKFLNGRFDRGLISAIGIGIFTSACSFSLEGEGWVEVGITS